MVKVSSSDIVHVLRRFDVANDETVPRLIEQIKFSHPRATSTLVSFRFNRQYFYILFDDTAEDDAQFILSQVKTDKQDAQGDLLQNPTSAMETYALPFKGREVYLFAVNSGKKRLDALLAERYPDTSRSTWQKHIKAGHVSVNGAAQVSSKYDVTDADIVAIDIPDATDYSEHALPILYIDDNVIVINKPVGILTHAKGALSDEFTVADFFRRYTTFGLESNRPGIVHRLDRDTSGVMIGARNPETATLLQKQFANRSIKKTYIAILKDVPKELKAKIDLPIGRNPSAPSTFRVDAKGKHAITDYEIVATNARNECLAILRPLTGRTHQLRVHMAYLNTPILGDKVYGKENQRLYLHAYKLEVTIPLSERRVFEAPMPPAFSELFKDFDTKLL